MRRLVLLAALLLAAPRAAHADGLYFTEAYGATHFKNELSSYQSSGFHIRAALGYRAHRTSVEAWFAGDLSTESETYDCYDCSYDSTPDPLTYGLDVKYLFPVSKRVEVYVRGSASRMQITGGELDGQSGRGLGVGTGIQLKGHAPLLAMLYPPLALVCLIPDACHKLGPMGTIAVYLDEGYDFYRLHGAFHPATDVEATRWRLGFSLGMDF